MAKSLAKNKNRKLRNGKNGNGNKIASKEQIEAAIKITLNECGGEILRVAKTGYEQHGRGCVNVNVKNHPSNPYQRGFYYYVTEEANNRIHSELPFLTVNDKMIAERISTYDPSKEAVVCVWHETMYLVTVVKDVYGELSKSQGGVFSIIVH